MLCSARCVATPVGCAAVLMLCAAACRCLHLCLHVLGVRAVLMLGAAVCVAAQGCRSCTSR